MAKNIINNPKDIIPNEKYLTLINGYKSYENDYVTYNGVYILQSYIENLKKKDTEVGSLIAQLFTIPITINKEGLLNIDHSNLNKITHYLDNTQEKIAQTLDDSKIKSETMNNEEKVYYIIGHLSNTMKEIINHRETFESFSQETTELLNSFHFFLNKKDYSKLLEKYINTPTTSHKPIDIWKKHIQKRIKSFINSQPPLIRSELETSQKSFFEQIEKYALDHLSEKYNQENILTYEDNNQKKYNQAIDALRIHIFGLNTILTQGEEDSKGNIIHHIQPTVIHLFNEILLHISTADKILPLEEQYDIIMKNTNISLAGFFNEVFDELTPEEKTIEIIKETKRLGYIIDDTIEDIVKYEEVTTEYIFIKAILNQLEREHSIYGDTDKPTVKIDQLFHNICTLENKFILALAPQEIQILFELAEYYTNIDLLEKLKKNKLLPFPKEID